MAWSVLLPRTEGNGKYKALCAGAKEKSIWRRVEFYQDSLSVFSENRQPVNIAYEDVEQIKETEGLIVLICAGRRGVMLAKAGFVSGSKETVYQLLADASE